MGGFDGHSTKKSYLLEGDDRYMGHAGMRLSILGL